ncbi:protein PLANT CADMIUM RESISTANCE 9-like [Fagus crenata]
MNLNNSKAPPPQQLGKQLPEGQWSAGLFDCLEDSSICCFTCLCPCIIFGRIAEIVDRGTTSRAAAGLIYCGLGPKICGALYAGTYRSKLRGLFSLPKEPCADWLVHWCCCVCSITQEYRELQNRGIDPSLGWEGNVEKWKREGCVPPIVAPGMSR